MILLYVNLYCWTEWIDGGGGGEGRGGVDACGSEGRLIMC